MKRHRKQRRGGEAGGAHFGDRISLVDREGRPVDFLDAAAVASWARWALEVEPGPEGRQIIGAIERWAGEARALALAYPGAMIGDPDVFAAEAGMTRHAWDLAVDEAARDGVLEPRRLSANGPVAYVLTFDLE